MDETSVLRAFVHRALEGSPVVGHPTSAAGGVIVSQAEDSSLTGPVRRRSKPFLSGERDHSPRRYLDHNDPMRHVRRTDAATVLSRPSRLQTRSRSRVVDDVRAASDPPRG